jgi:aspartyl-tRNA(Asn)/glutamyl-tRNA(Gln) amidotransferase subunit A
MGVYGPLTRTVEDAALVLDQLCGPSPHDPVAMPHPGISYLDAVRAPAPDGLRIAYSPDYGRIVVQSDVAEAVEDGVRLLEKLGHSVETLDDGPPPLGANWLALSGFGMAGRLARILPGREHEIARFLLGMIREGEGMTPEKFADIQTQRAHVRDWCTGVFERYDLLITPTTPYDPPPARGPFPLETEGRPQAPDAAGAFTMPFNTNWNPAATVRAGLSRAGLPIGMQIVGPQHRDDLVLRVARAFERERPWHPDWPQG